MDDLQLIRRLEAIEVQLKVVSDHLGIPCPMFPGAAGPSPTADAASGIPDEVVALARAGKPTEAISTYRKLTGATLLEAKKVVDGLK